MKKQIRNGLIILGILAGIGITGYFIAKRDIWSGLIFAGGCIGLGIIFYLAMIFKRKEK